MTAPAGAYRRYVRERPRRTAHLVYTPTADGRHLLWTRVDGSPEFLHFDTRQEAREEWRVLVGMLREAGFVESPVKLS